MELWDLLIEEVTSLGYQKRMVVAHTADFQHNETKQGQWNLLQPMEYAQDRYDRIIRLVIPNSIISLPIGKQVGLTISKDAKAILLGYYDPSWQAIIAVDRFDIDSFPSFERLEKILLPTNQSK